ncbi:DNA-J related domain-containing protein [Vibrio hannami]|nr:DNA-J related domain-containing protein [Vibrio hannami]MDG3085450.1 DNA-J related domain-containing protein [Vibrio hannami]
MDNPLILPIFQYLKQNKGDKPKPNWKVHEILDSLVKENLLPKLDSSPNKDLFKKNFLIMNALYELQSSLPEDKYLQVHSMDIRLFSSTQTQAQLPDPTDPLRDYYLDWSNYDTSEDKIQQLFDQFWLKYSQYVGGTKEGLSYKEALDVFELPEGATQPEIKRKWRKLALKWHPDREEGDKDKFRIYYMAWSTLRAKATQ